MHRRPRWPAARTGATAPAAASPAAALARGLVRAPGRALALGAPLILASGAALADEPVAAAAALPGVPAPRVETLAAGLERPWSIAFLPDGRELVTERPGRLRILDGGALSGPVAGVPPVLAEGQGGLFDVVPHPRFAGNALVYLALAHGEPGRNALRLVRARLEGESLVDLEVLFTARPWKATPVHFGGRVAFLPDGTLLLTVGDGFDHREDAQRLDNHLGKVVRLADDGSVPPDNPYLDEPGALPEIWSLGHRNAQGLAVHPATGEALAHEHGPAGGDEVNRLIAGGNYGWPIASGGRDYSGAAITPFARYPGTIDPLVEWTPSIAPSGLAIGTGALFPELEGELLVGALKSRELLRVRPGEAGEPAAEAVLLSGHGRVRDVRVAPDGSLRVLVDSDDGEVLRLVPGD